MTYINMDELVRVLEFVKKRNTCEGHIPDFVDLVLEYINLMPKVENSPEYGSDLQDFLRRRREVINMTRKELADKSGITYGTISNYEIGDATPSLINAQALAEALGCELIYREKGM